MRRRAEWLVPVIRHSEPQPIFLDEWRLYMARNYVSNITYFEESDEPELHPVPLPGRDQVQRVRTSAERYRDGL